MSILDIIAQGNMGGGAKSVLDAYTQGQKHGALMLTTSMELQKKAMEMEEWMAGREKRKTERELETKKAESALELLPEQTKVKKQEATEYMGGIPYRETKQRVAQKQLEAEEGILSDKTEVDKIKLGDYIRKVNQQKSTEQALLNADLSSWEQTMDASKAAFAEGNIQVGTELAKMAETQKYHQQTIYDKLQSSKVSKPPMVTTPSKEMIETAVTAISKNKTLGQMGWFNLGFSNDDYRVLGRSIASRAKELMAQSKAGGFTLNDTTAMSIATEELADIVKTTPDLIDEGFFGGKTLQRDIKFPSGTSKRLVEFLGNSASLMQNNSDIPRINTAEDYNLLPSGSTYIDPNGKKRVKK